MMEERRGDWTDLMGHGRDSPGVLWSRRAVTIPLYVILMALMLGLAPVLFPFAVLVDLLRSSPLVLTRFVAFLLLYLGCEVVGILISFVLWLARGPWTSRNREAYLRKNFALQCWWAHTLAGGAFKLFSIRVDVEGLEDFRDRSILLFVRHVSTADTVLPALLIGVPQRVMLRYVIKRELLLDPCLDIVGNRLPNYFAKRGSIEKEKEIEAVARLAEHLEPGQGVLTYPEGTRFTKAKREKVLRRLEEAGRTEALERARRMPCVLPPRPGGPVAPTGTKPGFRCRILRPHGFGNHDIPGAAVAGRSGRFQGMCQVLGCPFRRYSNRKRSPHRLALGSMGQGQCLCGRQR